MFTRGMLLFIPLLAACSTPPGASDDMALSDLVPITIKQSNSNGTMRYSVPIQIGDAPPIDAFFDTGSSGLRILADAVPDSALALTTKSVFYSYHSGLLITGVVANAKVSLGSRSTPMPIPLMLVQQVGCTKPCDAAGKTPADYTFFGGYKAILGVGMRSSASAEGVGSPIAKLEGHPAFIVHSPDYGGLSGTLELSPADATVASFSSYTLEASSPPAPLPDGTPSWNDRGIPSCVHDLSAKVDYCIPAELDTGNPPTYIEWPAHTDPTTTTLPSGTAVQVVIGPADTPLGMYGYTVGATPRPGIDEVEIESATGKGFMNLGTAIFFHYDVLVDPQRGIEGLATH